MTDRELTLIVATTNPGKLKEFVRLLQPVGAAVVGLPDAVRGDKVAETGATFDENAVIKAKAYASRTGGVTLADDSGLAVDALGGRPGLHSARYGGEHLPFDAKMTMLLAEMRGLVGAERRARFVCSIAIVSPQRGILCQGRGECPGQIAVLPAGRNGFGYDPIFIPDGYRETFGQLSEDIKEQVSHRRRAIEQIIPFLRHFYGTLT